MRTWRGNLKKAGRLDYRLSAKGFPIIKDALLYSVHKIVQEMEIDVSFRNKLPGRKWFD